MKAVIRRLRRLEEKFVPQEDQETQRVADLLRERRRRRLEANGEPFEDEPRERASLGPGRRLSIAETLRRRRQRAYERNGGAARCGPAG